MRNYYFRFVFCLFTLLSTHIAAQKKGFTNFVDPFIGTAAHGHTHPAATLPFGMVQLGPDTRPSMMDWDGCSGYHYTDSLLYGFSHTHLSGTGVPDLNDILVMPFMGDVLPFELKNYAAEMDKKTEKAAPGYYAIQLKKSKITCEMTATERVGVHRYTFPVNKEMVRLLVDLRYRDNVLDAGLNYVNDREISGFRFSKAWAENQKIYFVMRFSHAFSSSNLLDKTQSPNVSAPSVNSKSIVGLLHFYNDEAPLVVTVGISAVSIEGARRNLEAECPDYNFDQVRQNATIAWEKLLSSIAVEGGTTAQKRTFYTALYHSMLAPNLWSDVDKQYRGMDDQVHSASHDVYTTFSLWDTYRAANPLHALLVPDRMRNFIKTFLLHYRQGGLLPVWELAANETNCMIGNHAIPVILDAYTKGLVDPNDAKELLQAMLKSARLDRLGLEQYRRKGYIPGDEEPESVSKTLEYAYDDWCIAQFAEALGEKEIAAEFLLRSKQYANLYDPKTGFFRGKANGTWRTPFDPKEVNFNYTEANAWQYRFSVQQDIPGLIQLMGGRDTFARRLDGIFNEVSATTGRNQADITGLIGQYAHGNEPCHHVAYLFNDVQQPWKTQYRVKQIMRDLYTDKPDGLCGNDDCGQTSAWYVWSAMGFYPVTPGSAQYAIGAPAFEKVTLNLPNTKRFEVHSVPSFLYIQSALLNGQKYEATSLPHSAIMAGGKMDFVTGSHQSNWGTVAPPTTAQVALKSIPFIAAGERVFRDKQQIALGCADAKAKIFYKINNGKSRRYQKPFTINRSCNVQFWVEQNGQSSVEETARFFKKMNDLKVISYKTPYNVQYTGGGMDGLVDLLAGGADFRSGGWQGFEGADMEVVLDFGKKQEIKRVAANFIQDENSWIFFPVKVEMETSDDGVNFTPVGKIVNQIPTTVKGTIQQSFATNLSSTQARYLRVRGVSMGKCPPEHKGAGYSSWLFADEIWVD